MKPLTLPPIGPATGSEARWQAPAEHLALAVIARIGDDGTVWIERAGASWQARIGVAIQVGEAWAAGDAVLVLHPADAEERPVIVSRIVDRLPATPAVLTLRAADEIALECGEASVHLHRDGRIIIHGGYVESYAEGVHRIKGAQVRIN